ncbi:MAG: N-acetyltransferase, partial [Bacteroidales bacterium]|nr:N-acetyltransferase [Bacteroidales bacterium]
MKDFIYFPEKLYKNEPNWVHPLYSDEFGVLSSKNPAFEFCEAVYWLAKDENGQVIGRIAAIINHNANRDWNEKIVRFGWLDFVEDEDLLRALVAKVVEWGKSKG